MEQNTNSAEKWLEVYRTEGFSNVFEWHDPANTVYEAHSHRGKVSIFVIEGSCTFDFSGVKRVVQAGERFDVPTGAEHSAVVGPDGWKVVVGEEFEGDA